MKLKYKILLLLITPSLIIYTNILYNYINKKHIDYDKNNFNADINSLISIEDDENFIRQAKVDTLYPITTIRKSNSKNSINLLFFGDNFNNDFADYVYNKRVEPWFYNIKDLNIDNPIIQTFQTYLSNNINVYAIELPNNSDYSGFFNVENSEFLRMPANGWIKTNVLVNDFNNNFNENENSYFTKVDTVSIVDKKGTGRANAADFALNLTSEYNIPNVGLHELAHSFGKLVDEYYEYGSSWTGVNRTSNKNNVPWKEFLGFRGVKIEQVQSGINEWIPSNKCLMNSVGVNQFCEVCAHYFAKGIANRLQIYDLYIADPQLTIEHEPYTSSIYNTDYLVRLEVFDENLHTANNKKLEFRTVVDNWTNETKEIKMQIKITSSSGTQKFIEEKDFQIQPNELKGLFLQTTEPVTNLVQGDKITAHIIDLKTNKVLATHEQRQNSFAKKDLSSSDNTPISNPIRNLYPVKINYKIKDTNKDIPNTYPLLMLQRKGEVLKINKTLFNGYKFVSSSIPEMEITISENNPEITLYYEELPKKELKLRVLDNEQKIVQEKIINVYENQVFIPKETDFFLYDLREYTKNSISDNKKWTNKVLPPQGVYNYNDILDGQIIEYKIQNNSYSSYIDATDRVFVQGKNSSFSSNLYYNYFDYSFSYDNSLVLPIVYNNVDINVPGVYKMIYYLDEYNNSTQQYYTTYKEIKATVIPNNNESWKPNYLDSEILRLNSISFLPNLNDIFQSEFNSIDKDNLINYISNGSFIKNRFNYEVVITDKFSSWINFYFRVTYNGEIKETNSKILRFNVIEDGSVDELDYEINKINELNLSLKKNEYTQEEISKINASNILQNLDNWIENSKFLYEVIEFSNINNSFKFKIKISDKNNSSNTRISKEFILTYTLINNNIELEKNRIDSLISTSVLSLNQNVFSQQEINLINESNIINYIQNWDQVIINNEVYNYEIINFSKENNSIKFKIKIINKNTSSIYVESNFFSNNYIISDSISEELNAEKNRIDGLNLSLNKTNFSQSEFDELIKNNSLITKYLNNWIPNNNFTYNFLVEQINNKLQVIITIQKVDNPSNSINANPILVDYEIISNASNNNLIIILLSTLIPVFGLIIVAILLVVIYKKKKNKRNY